MAVPVSSPFPRLFPNQIFPLPRPGALQIFIGKTIHPDPTRRFPSIPIFRDNLVFSSSFGIPLPFPPFCALDPAGYREDSSPDRLPAYLFPRCHETSLSPPSPSTSPSWRRYEDLGYLPSSDRIDRSLPPRVGKSSPIFSLWRANKPLPPLFSWTLSRVYMENLTALSPSPRAQAYFFFPFLLARPIILPPIPLRCSDLFLTTGIIGRQKTLPLTASLFLGGETLLLPRVSEGALFFPSFLCGDSDAAPPPVSPPHDRRGFFYFGRLSPFRRRSHPGLRFNVFLLRQQRRYRIFFSFSFFRVPPGRRGAAFLLTMGKAPLSFHGFFYLR